MKKISLIVAALMMTIGLSQCSKRPNMPVLDGLCRIQTITFANADNSGQKGEFNEFTKELQYTWQAGDKVHVYATTDESDNDFTNGRYCGVLYLIAGEGETTARFRNQGVRLPIGTKRLRFVHYGRGYDAITTANDFTGAVTADLAVQTGSLQEDVSDRVIAYCDKPYENDGVYENCPLAIAFAVVKFDLSNFAATVGCNVIATGFAYNTVEVGGNGKIGYGTSGNKRVMITGVESTKTEYYVMLAEGVTEGVTSTVTFSGNDLEGSWNSFDQIKNGKFYYCGNEKEDAPGLKFDLKKTNYVNFDLPGHLYLRIHKYNLGVIESAIGTAATTAKSYYGNYYAWGEIAPKDDYTFGNKKYKWQNADGTDNSSFTKYCTHSGTTAQYDYTQLLDEDDAVYKTSDCKWRMPTVEEFTVLFNNSHIEYTDSYAGISGNKGAVIYKKKSKGSYNVDTDVHIFMPTSGDMDGKELKNAGRIGFYWTKNLYNVKYDNLYRSHLAYNINVIPGSGTCNPADVNSKCYGFTLRSVSDLY